MPTPTSGSTISKVPATGKSFDVILDGTKWGSYGSTAALTITYSFPGAGSYWSTSKSSGYGASTGDGEPWNGFMSMTASAKKQIVNIFKMISSFTNLTFKEVTESSSLVGDIRFGFTSAMDEDAAAHAYMPGDAGSMSKKEMNAAPYAGDVWVNADSYSDYLNIRPGSFDYATLIHEIGHALGLKHTFEKSGKFPAIAASMDSYRYSIMSYSAIPGNQESDISFNPTTFMALDVYALQYLYGKNKSYNKGDTIYTFKGTGQCHQVLWDAGGNDTIVYKSTTGGVINLKPGAWQKLGTPLEYYDYSSGKSVLKYTSQETVQILKGVTIENAKGGSGADKITGNSAANVLSGGGGRDTIKGGSGNDTIKGGSGKDKLFGENGNDKINGGSGNDAINGGAGKDVLTGGTGKDTFVFNTKLGSSNVDRITDFTSSVDTIKLSKAIFTSLKSGVLSKANFHASATGVARDSNDFILYASDSGKLFYDPDGSGSKPAVAFAIIGSNTEIKASDFIVA